MHCNMQPWVAKRWHHRRDERYFIRLFTVVGGRKSSKKKAPQGYATPTEICKGHGTDAATVREDLEGRLYLER
jgi:hypothetical protein